MAKVTLNAIVDRFRGKIGNLVFRRSYGATSVSPVAEVTPREPSPAQAAAREVFDLAATYGRAALADPVSRAFYAAIARERNKPLFSVPLADYYNPPVVAEVDVSAYHGHVGDTVRVLATDDVEVASVQVAIRDSANAIVEQGSAVLVAGAWVYTATAEAPVGEPLTVDATAKDRPGHANTKTVPVTVPAP